MIRLCVTGHRPHKLLGRDVDAFALNVFRAYAPPNAHFHIGMAIGWDVACAAACMTLEIPFTAVIPFVGQELRWSTADRMRYKLLLGVAERVEVVSRVACKEAYTDRNKVMVDATAATWALWDGTSGGTAHCVKYSIDRGRTVWNYWDSFSAYFHQPAPERPAMK